MTSRSTTLRTDGCRRPEKGVEQAPEHPWQPRPRRPPPEQPPWWRWGWNKALGWEQWNMRSAEEGQTIAQPQHLYNPSLRTPAPPGLPMEGQTTAGKGPEGDGTHLLKPEGPGEGAHPPAPLWSAYNHQDDRRKRSASRTVCHLEKSSQQGNPRRAASRMTPSGNCRCTKTSRRNTPRRRSKSWQHP